MKKERKNKQKHLEEAGLLNSNPEAVKDSLFLEHPDFFDPNDLLQVRYELLRAHIVDHDSVVAICKRYGISRQTFYNLSEKLESQGSAGLLPERRGPRGASKVTREVIAFTHTEFQREHDLSGAKLALRIGAKFGISIHRRTVEKLLREFRSKKNR
jgi:transposase